MYRRTINDERFQDDELRHLDGLYDRSQELATSADGYVATQSIIIHVVPSFNVARPTAANRPNIGRKLATKVSTPPSGTIIAWGSSNCRDVPKWVHLMCRHQYSRFIWPIVTSVQWNISSRRSAPPTSTLFVIRDRCTCSGQLTTRLHSLTIADKQHCYTQLITGFTGHSPRTPRIQSILTNIAYILHAKKTSQYLHCICMQNYL